MTGSAEVYFDMGLAVYALTSKRGKAKGVVSGAGLSSLTVTDLHEGILEALSMIADLQEGSFFFEKMALPSVLGDISHGEDVTALLQECMRKREGEGGNQGGF